MEFPIDMSMFLLLFIILLLAFYAYKGFRNGLIVEAIKTVSVILSAIGGWLLSGFLNTTLKLVSNTSVETGVNVVDQGVVDLANRGVLFLIFFVLCFIVLWIARRFLKKLNDITILGSLNQVLGSVLGLVKACLYVMIFMVILSSPMITNSKEVLTQSGLMPLKQFMQENVPIAKDILNGFDAFDVFINTKLLP